MSKTGRRYRVCTERTSTFWTSPVFLFFSMGLLSNKAKIPKKSPNASLNNIMCNICNIINNKNMKGKATYEYYKYV